MEATAKHDFNATAEDELSFRKQQVLKVKVVFYIVYFPERYLLTLLFTIHDDSSVRY